jgi:hypothetical protein
MNKTIAVCDLCKVELPTHLAQGGLNARGFALPGGTVHVCGACIEAPGSPVGSLLDVIEASLKAHPWTATRDPHVLLGRSWPSGTEGERT